MAIESGANDRDVKVQAPGLRGGVYVDPSLRSTKAYADVVPVGGIVWDGEEVGTDADFDDLSSSEPVEMGGRRVDDEDLDALGFGPSLSDVVAKVMDSVGGEFGTDEDMVALEEALRKPNTLDLDGVNASEVALAGVNTRARKPFKIVDEAVLGRRMTA